MSTKVWLFIIALAAADFFVPFFLLKDVPKFYGSYLFWSGLTLLVIIGGIIYTRNWGRDKK